MHSKQLPEAFIVFSGFSGDHCYAIRDTAARKGFPYLNGNVQPETLSGQPHFRHFEKSLETAEFG